MGQQQGPSIHHHGRYEDLAERPGIDESQDRVVEGKHGMLMGWWLLLSTVLVDHQPSRHPKVDSNGETLLGKIRPVEAKEKELS
jgi:hypothetical protein